MKAPHFGLPTDLSRVALDESCRSTVEHPFATLKYRIFGHLRLILRGRQGAQADELDGHLQLKTFSADRRWPPRWPQPELISDYISCSWSAFLPPSCMVRK